jgi:hypothetical protein
MSLPVAECGFPVVISSATTTTVCPRPCQLLGFYLSSTTGGTIVIQNGSTAISGTITPTALNFHAFPADIGDSLVVVTANTINCTFFFANAN